jgi:hypothetical protein
VHLLLTPPAERDDLAGEVPELDLAPPEDPDLFTEDQWQEADRLLTLDGVPRRLSGLLAQARVLDPELPQLIALRVLHAMDPEVTSALRQGDRQVLIAVDDGTPLVDPEFGGVDLLVALAELRHEEYGAEQARGAGRSGGTRDADGDGEESVA